MSVAEIGKPPVSPLVTSGVDTEPKNINEALTNAALPSGKSVGASSGRWSGRVRGRSSGRGVPSGRSKTTEMINRIARGTRLITPTTLTVDWTQTDWEFWDKLRRGKLEDYDLGGLFAAPIARILTSWGFGDGFTADIEHEKTSDYVANWTDQRLPDILGAIYDSFSLGDGYLMVNPDGTTVRLSPNQVQILCDPPSSQNVIGYKVTTRLESMTQIDYFFSDRRVIELHRGTIRGALSTNNGDTPKDATPIPAGTYLASPNVAPSSVVSRGTIPPVLASLITPAWSADWSPTSSSEVFIFPNLSGKIPVVHFRNDPGANELYGHPFIEALLKDFQRYNRVIHKALDGVEVMGNPIPTVEGVDDPDGTIDRLSTSQEQYIDHDGNEQTRFNIDLAQVPFIVLGTGGNFKMVAPQQFTGDAGRMLELLFLLMLQHCGIPEWVWGGAVASSKASVESQMPAFEKLIGGLRQSLKHTLWCLLDIAVSWALVYESGLKALDHESVLSFQPISPENEEALVKKLTLGRQERAITKETLVRKMAVVNDPKAEVEAAKKEAEEEMPEDAAMLAYANMLNQNGTPPPGQDKNAPAPGKDDRTPPEAN